MLGVGGAGGSVGLTRRRGFWVLSLVKQGGLLEFGWADRIQPSSPRCYSRGCVSGALKGKGERWPGLWLSVGTGSGHVLNIA